MSNEDSLECWCGDKKHVGIEFQQVNNNCRICHKYVDYCTCSKKELEAEYGDDKN